MPHDIMPELSTRMLRTMIGCPARFSTITSTFAGAVVPDPKKTGLSRFTPTPARPPDVDIGVPLPQAAARRNRGTSFIIFMTVTSQLVRGKRIARGDLSGFETFPEPPDALRARTMRERFRDNVPLRLPLNAIVADRTGRRQRFLDVAGLENLPV